MHVILRAEVDRTFVVEYTLVSELLERVVAHVSMFKIVPSLLISFVRSTRLSVALFVLVLASSGFQNNFFLLLIQ